jgi:hypothetical protein
MHQAFEARFKSLEGSWRLKREISTGETLDGKAVFKVISNTAFLMREEGQLVLMNQTQIPASRSWYWHLSDENTLEITYDAARLEEYHLVKLAASEKGWHGEAQHLCGADLYCGEYSFYENGFEIIQIVKGPKKDYTVRSFYSK